MLDVKDMDQLSFAGMSSLGEVPLGVFRYGLFESLAQLQAAADCDQLAIVVIEVEQFGIRLRLDGAVVLTARDGDESGRVRRPGEVANTKGWQCWRIALLRHIAWERRSSRRVLQLRGRTAAGCAGGGPKGCSGGRSKHKITH